jgi:hypothetical protein
MSLVNPTAENIRDFAASAPDGPICMLNLMRFRPGVDQGAFFAELRRINEPFLERAEAEIVYRGSAGPDFVRDEKWDVVILVRYPNYSAFMNLVTDADWEAEAGALRKHSLAEARLILSFSPD